jgi:hypothetical protein
MLRVYALNLGIYIILYVYMYTFIKIYFDRLNIGQNLQNNIILIIIMLG